MWGQSDTSHLSKCWSAELDTQWNFLYLLTKVTECNDDDDDDDEAHGSRTDNDLINKNVQERKSCKKM